MGTPQQFQRDGPGSWFLGPSTITSVLSITKTKTQMFLWSFWIKYSASENTDEKSSSVDQIGTGKAELAAAGCSYIQHTTESQPWRFLLSICVCFKSRAVLAVGLNKPHTHTQLEDLCLNRGATTSHLIRLKRCVIGRTVPSRVRFSRAWKQSMAKVHNSYYNKLWIFCAIEIHP